LNTHVKHGGGYLQLRTFELAPNTTPRILLPERQLTS